MAVRLPTVLTPALFPQAELSALRLDGEAFSIGDGLVPVDVPVDAAIRAASIAGTARRYALVAERWTAAWVHGAVPVAPVPHQLCSDVERNGRTRMLVALREVLFQPGDVEQLAGLAVTTPLRTACDLARLERDTPVLEPALAALLRIAHRSPEGAAAHLAAAPQAPYKRRGCARLAALAPVPPVER